MLSSAWSGVIMHLIRKEGDVPDPIIGLEILAEGLDNTLSKVIAPGRKFVIVSDIPR
jgi:hypothetical protein